MEETYTRDEWTEVPYLFANGVRIARAVYYTDATDDMPLVTSGASLRVFFDLGDHLGSTSVVLDKATGELVERSTYQPFGATESDYRPERWQGFREDYKFTGKEEDVEVGLQYFGKRFLNPYLGRWVSPDPLEVHGPGVSDPNVYAYVKGNALKAVDALGLDDVMVVAAPDTQTGQFSDAGAKAQAEYGQDWAKSAPPGADPRHVVTVREGASKQEIIDAWKTAAEKAGSEGTVLWAVGHGSAGGEHGEQPFFELAPTVQQDPKQWRLTLLDLKDGFVPHLDSRDAGGTSGEAQKNKLRGYGAKGVERLDVLDAARSALQQHQVKRVEFLTCRLGASREFQSYLTHRLQTTTVGHKDYIEFRGEPSNEVGYEASPDTSKDIPRDRAMVREIQVVRKLIREQFGGPSSSKK